MLLLALRPSLADFSRVPTKDRFEEPAEPVATHQGIPGSRVQVYQEIAHHVVGDQKLPFFAPQRFQVGLPVYEVFLHVYVDVELVHLLADYLCQLDSLANVEEYRAQPLMIPSGESPEYIGGAHGDASTRVLSFAHCEKCWICLGGVEV